MYTYEQRITAVKLYIKYWQKAAPVIRELGYPNRHVLVKWFKEYEATGDLHQKAGTAKSLNLPKKRSNQHCSFIGNMVAALL